VPLSDRLVRPTDQASILEYLSGHRMFGVLQQPDLESLLPEIVERIYPKYHRLYHKGEPTTHVYIVRSGLVVSAEEREEGNGCTWQIYASGDVLCSGAAILDRPHVVTATALADSTILLIPRGPFDRLWRGCPEMVPRIIQEMYTTLRRTEQAVVSVAAKGAIARIAEFLLSSDPERDQATGGEGMPIRWTLTHEDIAFLLGLSRETVSRAFSRLSRMKIIATGRRRIVILNPSSLAELARS